MNPLVAIAASVLPDILKAVVGRGDDVDGREIATRVARAVADAANTNDPERARATIAANPEAASALRIRLAEIAAEAEDKRQRAALKAQELGLRETEARQSARLDEIKAEMELERQRRSDALADVRLKLEDVRAARSALRALSASGSPMAWGAPLVSVIVSIGFFLILFAMIAWPALPALDANSPVFQIINVAIGALATAFATVVSFWLGSSQGSRTKDAINHDLRTRAPGRPLPPRPDEDPRPARPTRGGGAGAGRSNFQTCVDIVLAHEGGYADHPSDPGGAANWGITRATLEAWRGAPVTKADVRNLSEEEAREIYFANYWNALSCDALPPGVDCVVFDFGVNAGPARAARLLQRVVAVKADGVVGPETVQAAASTDPAHVIRALSALRLDYYRSLATWKVFGRGWRARTGAVERAALAMLG